MQTPAPEREAKPDPTPTLSATPKASAPNFDSSVAARTTVPPSVAPATPVVAPVAVAVALVSRGDETPPGGWGQSFARPLVADEAELAALRSRYRGVRTIAIDVDASGRATHVEIPDSVTGDAREELTAMLLALRYVPAECNGLRCTGTLQLAL